jgi:hypothetical protein
MTRNNSDVEIGFWKADSGKNASFRVVFFLSLNICMYSVEDVGRDSSVGIATRYGLDGPGIESRWGRDFSRTSRPALGPTQLPIKWVPGLSQG